MSDSNGISAFIDDGYSIDFFIPGEGRMYPDVRGVYRPMTSQEIVSSNVAIKNATSADAGEVVIAQWMSKRILKWDINNREGDPVEINPENILRIHPRLSKKLHELVYSLAAPEEDPAKN